MTQADDWHSVGNLLCIRLDNMGDVLMSTPAMRALKDAAPERRLTLLCSGAGAQVAPFIPEIDDVLIGEAAWVKNQAQGNAGDRQLLAQLERGSFDGAIIFTVYSQSALPAALMCH